jgi:hypothetical protein
MSAVLHYIAACVLLNVSLEVATVGNYTPLSWRGFIAIVTATIACELWRMSHQKVSEL